MLNDVDKKYRLRAACLELADMPNVCLALCLKCVILVQM
jgi:hypothetical protein